MHFRFSSTAYKKRLRPTNETKAPPPYGLQIYKVGEMKGNILAKKPATKFDILSQGLKNVALNRSLAEFVAR